MQNPSEHLTGDEATALRAIAASANYLALDKPDVAFSTKEICRAFAEPTRQSVDILVTWSDT